MAQQPERRKGGLRIGRKAQLQTKTFQLNRSNRKAARERMEEEEKKIIKEKGKARREG